MNKVVWSYTTDFGWKIQILDDGDNFVQIELDNQGNFWPIDKEAGYDAEYYSKSEWTLSDVIADVKYQYKI